MDDENNVNFSSSSLSSSKQEATLLVLTFDLDDTIWPTTPVVTAANESYIEWLQSRVERFPETKVMNQLMKGIREEREELFRKRGEEHVVSFSFRFFFFLFFFALASRACAC
jgi:putative hydrolase of the HAD superfamily